MADQTISRRAAMTQGLKRYFTGLPCKRGHVAERLVNNKTCTACDLARKIDDPAVKRRLRAYYAENRDKIIEQNTAYTAANPEKVRERRRKHREANKDRLYAERRAWAQAHPEKRRVGERNRETRERGAEGSHTYAEIMALGERQGWRCAYCPADISAGWHEDHVMPIARGGTNWISNIALACQPCNQSKHARDPAEWMQEIQLKRPWRWSRGECRS